MNGSEQKGKENLGVSEWLDDFDIFEQLHG